jgi:hypothetical protein
MPRANGSVYGVRFSLPVVKDHQAVRAGRDVCDLLVEHVVHAAPTLPCLGRGVLAEVILEPLEDGAGGDLAALDRVLAGDDGVGVSAEESLAAGLTLALADQDVRGAGDERHLPWLHDVRADLADPGVAATLGHRGASLQPEFLGGLPTKPPYRHAESHHFLGQLLEHVLEPDLLVEVHGPAAEVAIVEPSCRCRVDVRRQPSP